MFKAIAGAICITAGVVYFMQLSDCASRANAETRIAYANDARQQAHDQWTQQAQQPTINTGSIAATKDVAQKIAAAAPAVLEALKECPEPIDPGQITAHWGIESGYCPGLPEKMCPVSVIKRDGKIVTDPTTGKPVDGAHGPMGHMRSSWETWGKKGESPEVLADAMKMTVRHLCFAKKDGQKLVPSSDAAILRYNHSTAYLNDIRSLQTKHSNVWASIKSGGSYSGPIIAGVTSQVPRPHIVDGPPKAIAFESQPFDGYLDWFSAWGNERHRDTGKIVPHQGVDFGKRAAVPIKSVCAGTVEFAGVLGDGLGGNTVQIVCENDRTSHMHLASISVRVGEHVSAGQQIGINGQSGNAAGGKSGNHDHFKLESKNSGGQWVARNPCAGYPGERIVNCGAMFGPNTYFAPLNPVDEPTLATN